MDKSLTCFSYNCRGFNEAQRSYISGLLMNSDVFFLQEHWLSDGQLDMLDSVSADHLCTAVSGFDSSEVLKGCPYGGCAVFWRRNLSFKISPVKVESKRLCCLSLSSADFNILCINAYMSYEY